MYLQSSTQKLMQQCLFQELPTVVQIMAPQIQYRFFLFAVGYLILEWMIITIFFFFIKGENIKEIIIHSTFQYKIVLRFLNVQTQEMSCFC